MSIFNTLNETPTALSARAGVKFHRVSIAFVVMAAAAGFVALDSSRRPAIHARPAQPVHTQNSSADMARCEQLYTTWSDRYANDGSPALCAHWTAESAILDCEQGDFAGGRAELERLLRPK